MRGQALLAAAVAASVLAWTVQPAAAQNYGNYPSYHTEHVERQQQCRQERNNGAVAGAIIGGIAGAVLGSQAAARGHRTDGSALGAVVGATAGAAIGRSSADNRCDTRVQGAYDPYYGQPYGQYGYDDRGYGDRGYDDGLAGGPYRESSYGGRYDDANCRWGEQILRDPHGRETRESVYMCRGRDGVWRPS